MGKRVMSLTQKKPTEFTNQLGLELFIKTRFSLPSFTEREGEEGLPPGSVGASPSPPEAGPPRLPTPAELQDSDLAGPDHSRAELPFRVSAGFNVNSTQGVLGSVDAGVLGLQEAEGHHSTRPQGIIAPGQKRGYLQVGGASSFAHAPIGPLS